MVRKIFISIIAVLVVGFVLCIFWLNRSTFYYDTIKKEVPTDLNNTKKDLSTVTNNINKPDNEKITVSTPQPDEVIKSPLAIAGQAKGHWFFEASFPVSLIDSDGVILANGTAQAQGEWMTENFVPFISTLEFPPTSATSGVLILKKDNPSGLPENDEEIKIPIKLK